MLILLDTQFNSFYQAFLILFSVVLSTAGVTLGLLITGNPVSAMSTGVGVVALVGIVLIDTYNHLRRRVVFFLGPLVPGHRLGIEFFYPSYSCNSTRNGKKQSLRRTIEHEHHKLNLRKP